MDWSCNSGKSVVRFCPIVPAWKRTLDIACVVVAAPLLLPIMVVIALWIRWISAGPSFFIQKRVGFRGQLFNCIKFRTMEIDADPEVHKRYLADLMQSDKPTVKLDEIYDPRIIPCGSFLRASGLDELPQILNVLGGQMSLVGPRPCLPYEYEAYKADQMVRFETPPGLTGLWQISGRANTTYSDMIALDTEYVRTRSIFLDLKILLMTVPTLVSQVRDSMRLEKTRSAI
jgi:exopolysaccharide production protein ExoY